MRLVPGPVSTRLGLAAIIAFGIYNPSEISWWGWVSQIRPAGPNAFADPQFYALLVSSLALSGLAIVYIRVTIRTLGLAGITILVLLLAALGGLLRSVGLEAIGSGTGLLWLVQVCIWILLAAGSSAPQIYRWIMSVVTAQPISHTGDHHH